MGKLCTKCHYIGKAVFHRSTYNFFFADMYMGIFLVAIGIGFVVKYQNFSLLTTWYGVIGYLAIQIVVFIPLIWGGFNIVNYLKGGKTCPKCTNYPMLSLDNPEAIELIKKKDLSVTEKSSP